jgi:peroxiredoxin
MKNLIFPLIAAIALFQSCACGNTNQQNEKSAAKAETAVVADSVGYIVKVGDVAPDFTCTLTDGSQVKISDLKGKVVMLQFTASWCSICRNEMPHIEKDIWLKHKDNKDFVLIGVDRDEPLETVVEFGKAVGVTYPLALDPGADIFALYALRNEGITRNVLIDREGKIVMLTRKFKEDEFSRLCGMIDEMLK